MINSATTKTPITGGCYWLHEVEWGTGEAAGSLVSIALQKKETPHAVRLNSQLLDEFQRFIRGQGVETEWTTG